jgi:hypothetical protein
MPNGSGSAEAGRFEEAMRLIQKQKVADRMAG